MPKNLQMMILLVCLVLIWACGWPIIPLGLAYCPPLWYIALRLSIATLIVFIVMGAMQKLIVPTREDLPLIFSIGFFQIGVFVFLISLGLQYVPPGRSAIIAYTSPFFVTPIAILFFGETLSKGKMAGLLLGMLGIALLFSPWQLNWHDNHILLGNGLLLLSSLVWSAVMLHTRYAKWHRPAHLLLPWQLLVAALPALLIAVLFSPHPVIHWRPMLWFSLFYMAILATPVAYWMVITISRNLSIVTTSLALLAVPVVGLFTSAWLIGEPLTVGILTSLGIIIAGLVCVSLSG